MWPRAPWTVQDWQRKASRRSPTKPSQRKKMATQANLHTVQQRQAALLLNTQLRLNLQSLQENTTACSTYAGEFKKYENWVKEQNELLDDPLFSRENIDHYFTRKIAYKKGKPDTARKVVSSLQWYCNYRYNATAFTVESPLVLDALKVQKARGESTGNPGSDPIRGLKDGVPESDRVLMMTYIYKSRNDWDTAALNFAWGYQGAIRGASNRKLVFSDLNMSHGFGPEKEGPLGRALMLVMRQGALHKDRHDKDKQVCAWRHRRYVLCSVLATSLRVIWTLRKRGDTINFLRPNQRVRADWWNIPVIDWDEYNGKCDMS
jgi:hypothetical protein